MIVKGKLGFVGKYCQQQGLPYEEYTTPGSYLFITKTLDELSYTKYGRAHAFLAKLENVYVFGDGFILAEDGTIMVHGLNHRNYELDIKDFVTQVDQEEVTLTLPDACASIEEPTVLLWGNKNFGHWLFEHMPRTAVIARNPNLKDAAIAVTDNMPDRYIDFLKGTGVNAEQIRKYTLGNVYFFKQLWVPSVVTYRGHYNDRNPFVWIDSLFYLRQKVLGTDATKSLPSQSQARRIYISRRSAQWRKSSNGEQINSVLRKYQVDEVDMDGVPFQQQIDTVKNAELIIIEAGASSPITMYAPAHCVIIEFSPQNLTGTWGSMVWAHIMGQVFHRMVCTSEIQSVDSNYTVDVVLLEENIKKAIYYLHPDIDFYGEIGNLIFT